VDVKYNRDYPPGIFFPYYFFSEIIPMGTMLLIFEGPRVVSGLPLGSAIRDKEASRETSVDSGFYIPVSPPPEPEDLLPRSATMSETINSVSAQRSVSVSNSTSFNNSNSWRGSIGSDKK